MIVLKGYNHNNHNYHHHWQLHLSMGTRYHDRSFIINKFMKSVVVKQARVSEGSRAFISRILLLRI